mmetsp:Transcript_17935/g.38201  ORF Transcript_17935/g.38201 Transcript_17935/m.38201 type:complete len:621 (-) Transcript_17935:133-1995(-)
MSVLEGLYPQHPPLQQPPRRPGGGRAEDGYQWVDGPQAAAAGATAPTAATLPGQSPMTPQATAGSPMYQYQQQAGSQWVDGPSAIPPTPPVQQDMVFQWVDSPSYGRASHQQHYMQAGTASPYFQGLDSPSYGMQQRGMDMYPGLDPAGAQGMGPGSPLYGRYQAPQALPDATRYAPPRQEMGYDGLGLDQMGAYGQQPLSPSGAMPTSPQAAQYGSQGAQQGGQRGGDGSWGRAGGRTSGTAERGSNDRASKGDAAYGRGGDQGATRRGGGAAAAKAPGPTRGARGGKEPEEVGPTGGAARGRQPVTAGRQGGEAEAAPQDFMEALALEGYGRDTLRTTLTRVLESLYQDRIRPMSSYVKGRLKEHSCPEPLVKNFTELYSQHTDLFLVQRAEGSDESAFFLVTEPDWFKGWVDIDSQSDPYDEAMWEAYAKFLEGEHAFAGGRYGMARELMQRSLPFLAEYSLGEVCHIVQLAIQRRNLIVYHRKMLKPIQTVLCQSDQPEAAGAASEGEEIKGMDDLCVVLFRMLLHHPQGIRLCRMKQMVKHEFCRRLSETAFQCTKLVELFNREPLSTTFVLDTEQDGKNIYVRLGDPETFTEPIKRLYALANSTETKQAMQPQS